MVLLIAVVLFGSAIALLYAQLRKRPDERSLWRSVFRIGVCAGVVRAALASAGWYTVEHSGGPLQVPGFAFAMMAWPEAAIFAGRRTRVAPPEFYLYLALLLIASTTLFVALVALFARPSTR